MITTSDGIQSGRLTASMNQHAETAPDDLIEYSRPFLMYVFCTLCLSVT